MHQPRPEPPDSRPPIGYTALTWQVALIVLLIIPLFGSCIATFSVMTGWHGGWSTREIKFWTTWSWPLAVTLFATIILLAISQFRRRYRKDLHPDFLPRMFNPSCIYEAGPVHLAVFGISKTNCVRVIALVQNRFDADATFILQTGRKNSHILEAEIPPSALVLAFMDIPLAAGRINSKCFQIQLYPSATGKKGTQVRFAARRVPTTVDFENFVTFMGLLSGHLVIRLPSAGSGYPTDTQVFPLSYNSILEVPLPPLLSLPPSGVIDDWIAEIHVYTTILWTPSQPTPEDHIWTALAEVLVDDTV